MRMKGGRKLIILLALIILMLYKINIKPNHFQNDYLSKEKTQSIKGIFIMIVFISHSLSYITVKESFDFPAIYLCQKLGQLMVALFLFYSGYGIYESIKKKKQTYVDSIPKKRIAKVLFEFAIAVTTFLICNLLLQNDYDLPTILLSYIGWESIGNSNWYIFAIIIMYLASYIAFKVFENDHLKAIIGTTIISYLYIYIIGTLKAPYWVDTILCFPLGMWYSYYKDKIEHYFFQNNKVYFFSVFLLLGLFIVSYKTKMNLLSLNINAILFTFVVVITTMKVSIHNLILSWIGKNLFWVYILQRIPMMILTKFDVNKFTNLFFISSFIITIILAYIYSKIVPMIESKIWKQKKYQN